MASNFSNYAYTKHGVAESTLMLATMSGGHFYNLVNNDVDLDNGTVAVLGDFVEDDLIEAVAPTKKDKVVLNLTAPKIYEEYTKRMQEESQFYNSRGEAIRAYEIYETDRFTLSAECFNEGAVPEVGKFVVVADTTTGTQEDFKLTTVDADPNAAGVEYGFVGKIYKKATNGNFRVFVIRNREVE